MDEEQISTVKIKKEMELSVTSAIDPKNENLKTKKSILKEVRQMQKRICMVFNIGPSILHLSCVNKRTGHTFNYILDTYEGANTPRDYMYTKISKPKWYKFVGSNPELHQAVIRINIFKEKCICKKCVIATFLLLSSEASDLRYKLFRVLNSQYCNSWENDWIKTLFKQILLFSCCIDNGRVYSRLLDVTSECARKLLLDSPVKDILEIKYGLAYFHKNFFNEIIFQKIGDKKYEKIKSPSQKQLSSIPFIGTGKEEIDVIDGVRIVSFETENDLDDYTNLEFSYIDKISSPIPVNFNNVIKNYTKTDDITKIKGWKKKLLFSFATQMVQGGETNKETIKEKQIKENTEKSIEWMGNFESGKKLTENIVYASEGCSKNFNEKDTFQVEAVADISQEIVNKSVENVAGCSNTKKSKKSLEFPQKNKYEEELSKSESNIDSEHKINTGIFESDALNEFLKNNSKLNICFEIPMLQAAKNFKSKTD